MEMNGIQSLKPTTKEEAWRKLLGILNRTVVMEGDAKTPGELRLVLSALKEEGVLVFKMIDSVGPDGGLCHIPAIIMIYPSGVEEIIWNG